MNRADWSIFRWLRSQGAHKREHPANDLYLSYAIKARRRDDGAVIVKDYGDGTLVRFPIGKFPSWVEAYDAAEEYRVPYQYREYSPTGQIYTARQEVHFMAGEWWLWQRIAIDC